MSGVSRKILAIIALSLLATAGCGGWGEERATYGSEYLRRWKVTDSSGKVLSQGCTEQADPRYPMDVIAIHAATGSVITYEDNLGAEYMQKKRVGANPQLPTGDAYWCSNQDSYADDPSWLPDPDKVRVADANPPATIENVQHISPHNGTIAEGYQIRLKIQHPGVLNLGFLGAADLDAGADAGTDAGTQIYDIYPAMTIE